MSMIGRSELTGDDSQFEEQLQRRISTASHQTDKAESIHFGFKLGEDQLLIDPKIRCELVDFESPARLPNTPDYFCGLYNLRGNLLPVYNPSNLPAELSRYILVVDQKAEACGLVIESMPERVDTLDAEQIDTCQLNNFNECVASSFRSRGSDWHLIDHKQLFEKLSQNHYQFN